VLAYSASLVVTSQCYILLFHSAEHLPIQFTCPLRVVIHHAALCTVRPSDSPARFSPGTTPVPLRPSLELHTFRSFCCCVLPAFFPPAGLSWPPGTGVCRCSGGYCALVGIHLPCFTWECSFVKLLAIKFHIASNCGTRFF
jgi:hypothetical protein